MGKATALCVMAQSMHPWAHAALGLQQHEQYGGEGIIELVSEQDSIAHAVPQCQCYKQA